MEHWTGWGRLLPLGELKTQVEECIKILYIFIYTYLSRQKRGGALQDAIMTFFENEIIPAFCELGSVEIVWGEASIILSRYIYKYIYK